MMLWLQRMTGSAFISHEVLGESLHASVFFDFSSSAKCLFSQEMFWSLKSLLLVASAGDVLWKYLKVTGSITELQYSESSEILVLYKCFFNYCVWQSNKGNTFNLHFVINIEL